MRVVIAECARTWRRLGVARDEVEEMVLELEGDLAAAAAEGVAPAALIGPDVRSFAAAWARERGVVRARLRIATTALAALVGAVPGVGFALFVAYGLSSEAVGEILGAGVYRVGDVGYQQTISPPEWLLLVLYGLGALFAYAGAVAAVAGLLHWRFDPAAGPTVRLLAVLLPFATAAAVAATIAFAATRGFSTDLVVVAGEGLVACAVFSAGVGLVRLRAVAQERSRAVLDAV